MLLGHPKDWWRAASPPLRWEVCDHCQGEGVITYETSASAYDIDPPTRDEDCAECDGLGYVEVELQPLDEADCFAMDEEP